MMQFRRIVQLRDIRSFNGNEAEKRIPFFKKIAESPTVANG
jgi:hypothetical protein